MGFSNSGSSKLYGGSGVDSAKLANSHLETDGFLFEKFELLLQSNGIVLEGSNERLTPPSTSTFISEDIEIIYDKSGGYLMSDLLSGLTIKYTDDELKVIRDRMKTGNHTTSTTTPVASTNRTNEYGSRVPKNFDGPGSGLEGVADLFGTDSATSEPSRLENYDGFWYYPKENDDTLTLEGGSGRDVFLSYSDQALYTDDKTDNYFEILDFSPQEDLLILPFLTSDGVSISQVNNFIIADIGSGVKDKLFKVSQKVAVGSIGFADKFDSSNVQFKGSFEFAKTSNDAEDPKKNFISKPLQYKKKLIDKITNFNQSTEILEIDADSFGIDVSGTFAAAKNKKMLKKQLAKLDVDFLYDQKKGGLYFNENGSDKGFGDGGIIAILKGAPDLTSSNLEFI